MSETWTLDDAVRRDAADELAPYRDRFVIGTDPVAYLDGNSLGRLPKATVQRLRHLVEDEWGTALIRSWSDTWVDLPTRVGDRLGEAVLGAAPGQSIIADSTSVNLYKTLHAACTLRPDRREIVVDDANFPTDRFIVDSVAAARGMTVRWISPDPDGGVTADDLEGVLGADTAVVALSQVDYRSGHLADLTGLTALTHDAGALVVWDLCHSVGVVPVELDAAQADFAVGCTYKYLNAGPGAPAFLYVARRHQAQAAQPIPGWFGARDIFAMGPEYEPADSIRRMLSGTPHVSGIVAIDEGVRLVAEAGIEAIHAKATGLTSMVVDLIDAWLVPHRATLATPRDPAKRGGHVTVRHPEASAVTEKMVAVGVIPDFRNPDLIRLGLSPLTTTYAEAWTALDVMRGIIAA
ncbi:MAG: kynureninase [Actinomycetota bacterium]|nr:kynureninase [Actinomycetota bacterium]